MKKITAIFIFILLFSSAAYSDDVWLVMGDTTAKGAAGQIFAQLIVDKINAAKSGLQIDYYPNGELGGDSELLTKAKNGEIAITICQTAPVVAFVPEMAVFDLPMAFARYHGDVIDRVLNSDSDFRKKISQAYENAGLHLLGFMQNATYRLVTSNKDLLTINDFIGLKIRTMQNENHMAFWYALGAEPTPIAWKEVKNSLAANVIEAQENAADTCVGAGLYEVQKYLACTDHILYCNQICINAEIYNNLSNEHKQVLDSAVSSAVQEMRKRLSDIDFNNKNVLESSGMYIVEYDRYFFEDVLSIQAVKDLYSKIDTETSGLASALVKSLDEVEQALKAEQAD